jgi:DNA-binding transcriptional LysR family regulator
MSQIDNIRIFVRVMELGSLSAAGRHLRLSPAVVSHRLHQLEEGLGVRLLHRTTRQVQPTEQGRRFYEHGLDVLDAYERAVSSVATGTRTPKGNLRVTAPLHFGRRILGPLVPEFCACHPAVDVRLRLSEHLLDLLVEAVDLAIRMAELPDSSFIVRKIAECRRVLCAAPSYLDARGTPAQPEELLDHACLLLRYPGAQQFQWQLQAPDGPVKLAVTGRFDADDGDVLTRWALDGLGIVLKPVWEVAAHLRSGALRPLLLDCPPDPVTLAVLYPHNQLVPAKVRVFADFVIERARAVLAEELAGLAL